MKRANRLYLLAGVLAAASLAAVLALRYEQKQEDIQTSGETVLAIAPGEVTALSWETEDASLAFHKEEGWVYDEDADFPVSEDAINGLLEQFEDFKAAFAIDEVTDFGQYGLDDPVCTIRLTAGDADYTVELGNYSAMDEQRYVTLGDGKVYLAAQDPYDAFDAQLRDMIQNDAVPSFDSVQAIRFTGDESYSVTWRDYEDHSPYTLCSEDVYYRQESDALLPLDTSLVEGYLSSISNAGLTNYVTYKVTEEELAGYGLDAPEVTVEVDYTENGSEGETSGTFTLAVSRDPQERAAAQETGEEASGASSSASSADGEEEEITAYARVGDSPIVYQITGDSYNALMTWRYDDLRHREAFTGDFEAVNALTATLDGQTYTLEKDGDTFALNGEEADVSGLQTALLAVSADEFTTEPAAGEVELELTLTLDNEQHPSFRLTFYRLDGEHCLAEVDGEPFALVPRSQMVDLTESVNAIVL